MSYNDAWIPLIRRGARRRGLDPRAVLSVASAEGLGGGVGDSGTSFGPFQLHVNGALPHGRGRAWAESPEGVNYALDQIAGVARGLKGRSAIEAIVRKFERPADPGGEVARALGSYDKFGGGSEASAVGVAPAPPGQQPSPASETPPSGGFNLQGALLNQLASGGKIDFLGLAGAQQRSDEQRPSRLAQAAGEPPTPGRFPVGQGTEGKIIGTPYHGTHTVGNWESDNAIDEAIPVGTPVRSPFEGVIGDQIGSLGSSNPRMAGLRVHVEGRGNEAYLAHLSKLLVHAGQHVHRGQILGYSGSANGTPHLHEALKHGNPRTIVPLT